MECDGHGLRGRADYFLGNTFKSTASALTLGCLLMAVTPVNAQNTGQSGASALPPVTVDAPVQRAQRPVQARRNASARRSASQRSAQQANRSTVQPEPQALVGTAARVNAGTNGFVATRASGATKTDSSIMSTPASIAVITREEMDVRHAQSVRDLLRYAPGIYFSNDTDFRFQNVSARGFSLESVEVVEDDVKLAVRKSRGDAVHEIEKLDAAPAF
uniref:TonB-dependent receptor plug domain-containing protein n=2 Tax=Bradyrhizobium barranii TaxID=2992140 RepID=A0A7Z0TS96_9BRAD